MMQDYESEKLINEYLLMHYGSCDERMPWSIRGIGDINFVSRTVEFFTPKRVRLSLDLGCAVGGSSFKLSQSSSKVVGIDFSQGFIDAANEIKEKGSIAYKILSERDSYIDALASIPEGADPSKVSFTKGDAMNLPDDFKGFDRVHASNLLCRLPDPKILLDRIADLVIDGGEVVLATPFSWLEQYTPKEKWPTGDSWEWLQLQLKPQFDLTHHSDEPFLIREHGRKFQLGVSKVSVWRKRSH